MKMMSSALAAATLAVAAMSAPSSALAGFAAGNVREALPQIQQTAIQDVRERRRGVRHERRMRQERRVRHERRAERRCNQGRCSIVYVLVPVYYYVPVWYNHPVYYYY